MKKIIFIYPAVLQIRLFVSKLSIVEANDFKLWYLSVRVASASVFTFPNPIRSK